jgi:hypothetical protein
VAKAYASLAVAEAVTGNPSKAKTALQKAEASLARITGKSTKSSEDKASEDEKETDGGESESGPESEETGTSIAQNKKGKKPKNAEEIYKEIDLSAKMGRETNHANKGGNEGRKGLNLENFEGSSYELFTLAQKEEIVAMCKAVKQFLDGEKGIYHITHCRLRCAHVGRA